MINLNYNCKNKCSVEKYNRASTCACKTSLCHVRMRIPTYNISEDKSDGLLPFSLSVYIR